MVILDAGEVVYCTEKSNRFDNDVMAVTIRDIAREAQVSVSTASLAINGDPRVKEETKERIMRIAQRLRYHPTHAARSLSSGKSWSVNVINPATSSALSSGFNTRFLHGVHTAARKHQYTVSLTLIDDENEALEALNRMILEKNTDGVIIMNPSDRVSLLELLSQRDLPHVLLGQVPQGSYLSVDSDNEQVGFDAASALLQVRREPLLFVSGPKSHTFSQDRLKGFTRAHEYFGLSVNQDLILYGDGFADSAYQMVNQLLKRGSPAFSGIVAMSDALAIGAMRAVRMYRKRIPDDVAVIGMNNDDMTDYTDPTLSSVELNAYDLGVNSAQLLLESIMQEKGDSAAEEMDRVIVPHRLVLRGSTYKSNSNGRIL